MIGHITTKYEIYSTSKLLRSDNGVTETVTSEVEYISPDQHGGYFGTVYRQYHGAKVHNDSITVPGITKLITASGIWNNINVYNGYTDQGTSNIRPLKGIDKVTFIIVGTMPINEGWVDYTK